jgi:ribosomal protein S19E (S16A)
MAYPRPPPSAKAPALEPKEFAALRDVSKHRAVEVPVLRQLERLGLVEHKSGVWAITQQGQIRLMFGSAR